jgi:hypothetical protein
LVREAANAHVETVAAREASLQAKIEAAQEVKRVKEAMARQAEKEVASLKKKLEAAEEKAKDTADYIQAVVEGKFAWLLGVIFVPLLGLLPDFNLQCVQVPGRRRLPSRKSWRRPRTK